MTALAPGAVVATSVRLVRELGRGGMGSVWIGDHLRLETQVAVKFLDGDLVRADATMRARFHREAVAAAKINSPHAVRTFDHGEMEDGTPFIVMELLSGESLADRLKRQGRLGLAETGQIVWQVCKLLRAAHNAGVVHRDIKPGNLFLVDAAASDRPTVDDLFVKVLDFGIAKDVSRESALTTTTGAMFGTPAYMSPEQILSTRDVDRRADLWATAVVAYRCLTGALPFLGETSGAVIHAVCLGRFSPASSLEPELPRALDDFFQRALAADPEMRFASASELASAFAAAIGRPVTEITDPSSVSLREVMPSLPEPAANTAATWSEANRTRVTTSRRRSWLGIVAGVAALAFATVAVIQFASKTAPATPSAEQRVDTRPSPPAASAASSLAHPTLHPPATITAEVTPTAVAERPTAAPSSAPASVRSSPRPSGSTSPPTAASAPPKRNCSPPYVIDAQGDKRWKPECL